MGQVERSARAVHLDGAGRDAQVLAQHSGWPVPVQPAGAARPERTSTARAMGSGLGLKRGAG